MKIQDGGENMKSTLFHVNQKLIFFVITEIFGYSRAGALPKHL
jgi:hypothetical protein